MTPLLPLLATIVGAFLGGLFGFVIEGRRRSVDRRAVTNALAIEVRAIRDTLIQMRIQAGAETKISSDGHVKVTAIKLNNLNNLTRIYQAYLPSIGRIGPSASENVLMFYAELQQLDIFADAVASAGRAVVEVGADLTEPNPMKERAFEKAVNWFCVNWNLYLSFLEDLIDRAIQFLKQFGAHLPDRAMDATVLKTYANLRRKGDYREYRTDLLVA